MKSLPKLLQRKIYKTGQTRGADDDDIYQNRVLRNSTALIPYQFSLPILYPDDRTFEKGYIVLIPPTEYFESSNISSDLRDRGLTLGQNCLVFYETRQDWERYNPDKRGWDSAKYRTPPLGGQYVARVPATTAREKGDKIIRGFDTSRSKGAGIRQYEYASSQTIKKTRLQLEAIYWLCSDSVHAVNQFGMSMTDAKERRKTVLMVAETEDLLDYDLLIQTRIIDQDRETICPLCREKLSGIGFFNRVRQAAGREVPDITITDVNLFHIDELRYGVYNHRLYNLGWGHHHCNVVTKDVGIQKTLEWMRRVLDKNKDAF